MTDWTAIDLDTLLPGEPWTSGKALAVYENPIAITEGAAGAPRIVTGAFGTLVETIDPASEGTLTITDLGVYDRYIIALTGVRPDTIGVDLRLAVSVNGGSSFSTARDIFETTSSTNGVNGIIDLYTVVRLADCTIFEPSDGDTSDTGFTNTMIRNASGAGQIDAIRLSWSAGSFNAATGQEIRVYSTSLGVAP
jgi:hypothetical protein